MSWIDRLEHELTTAIPGAIFDLFMGRGGDGQPTSSAEDLYRPQDAQNPEIHIHANEISISPHTAREADEAQIEKARETEALYTAQAAEELKSGAMPVHEAAYYEALQRDLEQDRSRSL